MHKLYIVKDKTDQNFRKPFVSIHTSETGATRKISQMRNSVNSKAKELIYMEEVQVNDFDPNKTSVLVVFDKSDRNKKPFVSMHFDYVKANEVVNKLRQTLPKYNQKLVHMSVEDLSA